MLRLLAIAIVGISLLPGGPALGLSVVWDSDSTPYQGVRVRRGHGDSPRRDFIAAFVQLCSSYVHVVATAPASTRRTAGNWGALAGVQLAVNGDFFQYVTPPSVYGDAVGSGVRWPAFQTGIDDSGAWYYRDNGWIAVGPGWVEFSHTQHVKRNASAFEAAGFQVREGWHPRVVTTEIPPETLALVSGFPELVIEGKAYTCPDPTGSGCFPDRSDMSARHLRTAMGLSQDRRTLIFVVTVSTTWAPSWPRSWREWAPGRHSTSTVAARARCGSHRAVTFTPLAP